VSRRRSDNQGEGADQFDARIKTLQQAVRLGEFFGVKRMLHGVQKTGESALKKVHGVCPGRARPGRWHLTPGT